MEEKNMFKHDFSFPELTAPGMKKSALEITKLYYDGEDVTNEEVGNIMVKNTRRGGLARAVAMINAMKDIGETFARMLKDLEKEVSKSNKNKLPKTRFEDKVVILEYPKAPNFICLGFSNKEYKQEELDEVVQATNNGQEYLFFDLANEQVLKLTKNGN